MTDPAVPQRLAFEKRLADLERRVAELQRTPILTSASVTGWLKVRDSSSAEVMRLGELDGGGYGLTMRGPSGSEVLRLTEDGWEKPYFPVPMAYPMDRYTSVATTLTEPAALLGFARFTMTSRYLYWTINTDPGGATQETRVMLHVFRGSFPQFNLGQWTETTPTQHGAFTDLSALTSSTVDMWGAEANLFVQVRRVAGAVPVGLYVKEQPFLFG